VSGNRTVGVVLYVRRSVVTTVPVVLGRARGLSAVRQVPVAVRVRLRFPQNVEHDVGLAGVRDEVEVQVRRERLRGPRSTLDRTRPSRLREQVVHGPRTARPLPDGLREELFYVPVTELQSRGPRRHHNRTLRCGTRSVLVAQP